MLPRFRRGAFSVFVAVFFVSMLLGDRPVAKVLELELASALRGEHLWQLFTTMFVDPVVGGGALLTCLGVQWFCGSALEGFWSARRYLLMVLSCSTLGYAGAVGVAAIAPDMIRLRVLSGSLPLEMAAVVGFGFVFANASYVPPLGVAPVKGKLLAPFIALVLFSVPVLSGSPPFAMIPALLSGLCAALFVTQPWRRIVSADRLRRRAKQDAGRHLRVVRGPDDMLN
ncbi:MAG: hypothetical protein ACPHRO_07260 [Nannocystaceae bacterium]